MSQRQKGELKNSLQEYEQLLLLDPHNPDAYNNIGTNYLYLNRFDEAVDYFQKAIALNPRHVMAMSNLAVCYINKGEKKEAEKFLRKALKVDKNFVPARQNLERLLQEPDFKK